MLIVDAGPLVAASLTIDRHHERCVSLLTGWGSPLAIPALVVAEVAYLLGDRIGPAAELAFAQSIRDGDFEVEPVEPSDWVRIAELVQQYDDLPLGIADASIIVACERLGAVSVATLECRHFSVVRPRHCAALTLLPD